MDESSEFKVNGTGLYALVDIGATPEQTLQVLCKELTDLINELVAGGATELTLRVLNIADREFNPFNENIFVRVIGFRKRPPTD